MTQTLNRLIRHYGPGAKAIVWEHNTHIGDARFTDMAGRGEGNVGQPVRERHGHDGVVLVGFGCYQGSINAGAEWEAPMERLPVSPERKGRWEETLHRAGPDDKLLFSPSEPTSEHLGVRGHRAIGVVYHPEYEHLGNYVPTVLPRRYDAFLFLDTTRALSPLHEVKHVADRELPGTDPSSV